MTKSAAFPTGRKASAVALAHMSVGGSREQFIDAASAAGFQAIGLRICARRPGEPYPYPLIGDDSAVSALSKHVRDAGIQVSTINAYQFYPETEWSLLEPVVDIAAALGAERIMVNSFDPDPARFEERFVRYARAAEAVGVGVALEFMPYSGVKTPQQAYDIVVRSGIPSAGIVLDVLHLARCGVPPASLSSAFLEKVQLAQICDAPALRPPNDAALMEEARTSRLALGAGGLPLDAFLEAVPSDAQLEYELARRDLADCTPLERALAARADIDRFWARATCLSPQPR